MLKMIQKNQAKEAIRQEFARKDLLGFTKYNFKGDYNYNWFHWLLCDELRQFYLDVKAGLSPHLMVFAPPRSGKSEIISRNFPAWVYGQDPRLNLILSSYSDDLTTKMSRDTQRIMEGEQYRKVFTDTAIQAKGIVSDEKTKRTTAEFDVLQRNKEKNTFDIAGFYRAAGVGMGITGMGFDIGIIDDPIKDAAEAKSETVRNSIYDWYTTTFYTRKSPLSGVILMMTRWHEDDLAGRLLLQQPNLWKVIKFPAIATEQEKYRKEGEALHPARYDEISLKQIRETVGETAWASLYQQSPTTDGGNLYKLDWFLFVSESQLPQRFDYQFITVDTSYKEKEQNDFTVMLHWGMLGRKLYLTDMIRKQINAIDVVDWADKWIMSKKNKNFRYIWIEDKGHGIYLNQFYRKKGLVPTEEKLKEVLERKSDKVIRANNSIARIDKKEYNVIINKDIQGIETIKAEMLSFPNGKHDDIVDCITDGIMIGLNEPDRIADLKQLLGR
jgi:predicted phage terminase large subunit-like protein